jgi:5,5'-dehydrodivanillate O-demethylase
VAQLDDPPVEYAPYHKDDGVYRMDKVWMQDYMAWETAGPIYDRSREHLAVGDKGILVFRKLLKQQIDQVRRRRDPIGVIRSAEKNKLIQLETITDSKREVREGRLRS